MQPTAPTNAVPSLAKCRLTTRQREAIFSAQPAPLRSTGNNSKQCPPFYTISAISSVCNISKAQAIELIEFGNILFAFDVSTGQTNRDLRALPACVDAFRELRPCLLTWSDVCKLIVPDSAEMIPGTEIQRLLNIETEQLARLIGMSELKAAVKARRGRKGTAQIETASFVSFLKRRMQ
jgi:hypothetical protein